MLVLYKNSKVGYACELVEIICLRNFTDEVMEYLFCKRFLSSFHKVRAKTFS